MRTIVLNETNITPDGQNNKLVYRFPNSVQFKNNYVAVQSITMFYSWYNISAALGNNLFQYSFTTAGGGTTFYNVNIPDGLYDITTLNQYLQFTMLANGTYMTTADGKSNVFFLTLKINPTLYAVEVCSYAVPTAASNPNGYLLPSGSTLPYPTASFTPIPVFPATFNAIVGFPAGWAGQNWVGQATSAGLYNSVPYSWNATTGVVGYTSSASPQVNPNATIYLALSAINNPYSLPSSIIYAITPSNGIGGVIIDKPPQFCWNKFIDGTYNQLYVTFLGSDLSPIQIQDPNISILLAIKDGDEYGGK